MWHAGSATGATHCHRLPDPLLAAAVVHELVDGDLAVVVEVHRLVSSNRNTLILRSLPGMFVLL